MVGMFEDVGGWTLFSKVSALAKEGEAAITAADTLDQLQALEEDFLGEDGRLRDLNERFETLEDTVDRKKGASAVQAVGRRLTAQLAGRRADLGVSNATGG